MGYEKETKKELVKRCEMFEEVFDKQKKELNLYREMIGNYKKEIEQYSKETDKLRNESNQLFDDKETLLKTVQMFLRERKWDV